MGSLKQMGREDAKATIRRLATDLQTNDERSKSLAAPKGMPAEYIAGFEEVVFRSGERNR